MRRGEKVHAADGDIGRLQGLVVDGEQPRHLRAAVQGHWWGKKEVAIPIEHVTDAIFGVQLDLTKGQVKDLAGGGSGSDGAMRVDPRVDRLG